MENRLRDKTVFEIDPGVTYYISIYWGLLFLQLNSLMKPYIVIKWDFYHLDLSGIFTTWPDGIFTTWIKTL
jgi:hypothetical protein